MLDSEINVIALPARAAANPAAGPDVGTPGYLTALTDWIESALPNSDDGLHLGPTDLALIVGVMRKEVERARAPHGSADA